MLSSESSASNSKHGLSIALWGLLGFTLLIGEALYKVTPIVIDLFSKPLSSFHWVALIAWSLFMAYSEGYRGFQKHYSPRFAARAHWLKDHPNAIHPFLAPLFCMCFFGTTRKRKIVAYCLTGGIFLLVVLIRFLSQPWRGIIDVGVIIGLGWGLLSVYWFTWLALGKNQIEADPEVVI